MKTTAILLSAAMGVAFFAGCEKDATTTAANDAAKKADNASKALAASAEKASNTASGEVKEAAGAAADKAANVADAAKEAVVKQATDLYDKAMAMVKDKKFADAEGLVAQLEPLKAQLPADWAGKIDSLKQAIETGKKALQALPGGN